jgi:hypothetical protein
MALHVQPPGRPRVARCPTWLALGFPVLAAIALMTPRILDAHFGLFDDPTSISVAEQTWGGNWDWRSDFGFGRFRPVYWLAFSLIHRLAGAQAAGHFVGNLLLLAGTAVLLGGIVLRLTDSRAAGSVTGLAFVLGGPVIEAAYTLSKPELLQTFFLTASLAAVALAPRAAALRTRIAGMLGASFFVLLAALTKETTGLVLAIALAWLGVAWAGDRLSSQWRASGVSSFARRYAMAAIVGIGIFALGVLLFSPSTVSGAGPRANFFLTWPTIQANAHVWLDLIVRDWLQLLPLSVAGAYLLASGRKVQLLPFLLGPLVWMAAWFALYLPYRFTPEYYLLPFSLGAAVLTGLLAREVMDIPARASSAGVLVVRGSGALAAFLFLLTLPNNISNAGIQLSVDKANAAMLEHVAENAPADARIQINIRAEIEYLWQIGPMLHSFYHRPDLTVESYPTDDTPPANGLPPIMILSPLIENVPYPSVRLGIPEQESRGWEADMQREIGDRLRLQRETRFGLDMLVVDAPRLICLAVPRIDFCQRPHAPFDTRRFAAGWRVYELRSPTG